MTVARRGGLRGVARVVYRVKARWTAPGRKCAGAALRGGTGNEPCTEGERWKGGGSSPGRKAAGAAADRAARARGGGRLGCSAGQGVIGQDVEEEQGGAGEEQRRHRPRAGEGHRRPSWT